MLSDRKAVSHFRRLWRVLFGKSAADVRKNLEDLIEARDFEDRPEILLHGRERKFTAVLLSVLHSANKDRQTGTIKIRDLGEINDDSFRFMGNDLPQGNRDFGGEVEIYLAF